MDEQSDPSDPSQTSQATSSNPVENPLNGLSKPYNYSRRKAGEFYSAKTVFFYKEGDIYFTVIDVEIF